MAIAPTLEHYLRRRGASYDTLIHPPAGRSMETAALARVPGERVAKPVILEHDGRYVMAVVPATHQVRLRRLGRQLHGALRLAAEGELRELFLDCALGAVPALGAAYGLDTVVDEALLLQPEIYFEAGDHRALIRMSREQFLALLPRSLRASFSHHVYHGAHDR